GGLSERVNVMPVNAMRGGRLGAAGATGERPFPAPMLDSRSARLLCDLERPRVGALAARALAARALAGRALAVRALAVRARAIFALAMRALAIRALALGALSGLLLAGCDG